MKTPRLSILSCALVAIGCGRDLNKGKLPTNNTTANNTTANNTTAFCPPHNDQVVDTILARLTL